jgi:hypothetical protein
MSGAAEFLGGVVHPFRSLFELVEFVATFEHHLMGPTDVAGSGASSGLDLFHAGTGDVFGHRTIGFAALFADWKKEDSRKLVKLQFNLIFINFKVDAINQKLLVKIFDIILHVTSVMLDYFSLRILTKNGIKKVHFCATHFSPK